MSVALTSAPGERVLFCKGAVEEMLEVCTRVEVGDEYRPITPELTAALRHRRDRLNEDGQLTSGTW